MTSTIIAPKPFPDAVTGRDLVHLLLREIPDADPEPARPLGGAARERAREQRREQSQEQRPDEQPSRARRGPLTHP
jgi:hypothetical protein